MGNDNHTIIAKDGVGAADQGAARPGMAADIVMALRFYSRIPVGSSPHETPDLDRIARALPFASLFIGFGPALVLAAGIWLSVPPLFCALLAITANVLVTGAMAEDAIGDSADGLWGGHTTDRRLEILRDSRLGSYGATAIILYLGLKASAFAAFASAGPLGAMGLWLATGIIARSASLWLTMALPPARLDGASVSVGQPQARSFWLGALTSALMCFVLAGPSVGILGLAIAAALVLTTTLGWRRLCGRLIGGQTGDLIGGLQAVLEIATLCAFILFAGR